MANSFMVKLSFHFIEEKIRALKVGDEVLISGVVFPGRERCKGQS
jgi:tartrate dehydratase beta subunit/fumarate hydratase class I family protein